MKAVLELQGHIYLNEKALRKEFGIRSSATIWRWRQRGWLPVPIKLGNSVYYDKAEVEAALAKGQ